MKSTIRRVLEHQSLINNPPVLIDIGASGGLPKQWKLLAPYSICVAFDADSRDFVVSESANCGWKKLYSLNRLVSANSSDDVDFYLTKSPYCSSMLQPDNESLKSWAFSPLFDVDKVVRLPAVNLHSVLEKIGLSYIDWYKSDSQGADLRIFDTLPKSIIRKVISTEFEPGIIDAYKGEDKLYQLMAYMDKLPFWLSRLQIKGSHRLDQDDLRSLNFLQRKYLRPFLKIAPGWGEISYINKLIDPEMTCREYLLAWVFATIKGEHGFGLHVAKTGSIKFNEMLFDELRIESMRLMSSPFSYVLLLSQVWRLFLRK